MSENEKRRVVIIGGGSRLGLHLALALAKIGMEVCDPRDVISPRDFDLRIPDPSDFDCSPSISLTRSNENKAVFKGMSRKLTEQAKPSAPIVDKRAHKNNNAPRI